ncbi:YlxR family protein [Corynebacterium variabile]|uniref:YlxR family protein n=1 Tax=Corynebacterium variabile TaxID=1727 RepID=UPI003F8FAED9
MSDDRRTSTPVAGPQRTCIASRHTQSADRLLRCVAVWDSAGAVSVLPDPGRRRPGRGAWITATVEAYETAVQRRAFARALNVPAEADTQPVREYIVAANEKETDY